LYMDEIAFAQKSINHFIGASKRPEKISNHKDFDI
jgi:hypothetical protein